MLKQYSKILLANRYILMAVLFEPEARNKSHLQNLMPFPFPILSIYVGNK